MNQNSTKILGMDIGYYLAAFVICIIGVAYNFIGKGMIFAIPLLLITSHLFTKIGDAIPVWKDWVGGGVVLTMFAGAVLAKFIPETALETIKTFYVVDDFLVFTIGNLLICSIMGMDRKVLIRSAVGFLPTVIAGVICAYLCGGAIGALLGYGFWDAILYISQPIMGGGMGAGAIPMAKIYASAGMKDAEAYLSMLVAAVVLGNIISIIIAAVLNKLGQLRPSLTGNGQLVKTDRPAIHGDSKPEAAAKPVTLTPESIGMIIVWIGAFIILGNLARKIVPVNIHPYAWMIILACIAKGLNLFPEEFYQTARAYLPKYIALAMPPIMLGVGLFYTDIDQFVASISNPVFVLICVATVIGAVLGAGLFGQLFKFHFIESSITAGLCMANMGGSGDLAVLSAAKRMELMPFAQISSRLGGAVIMIMAGAMLSLLR
ncbi:MAG: 2-hydroxycarboxylate transporter family protein [Clostridia bacterium]|nr:2-hydroxycarboxylate transporter family protein [Clostridia bacterium]